MQLSPQPALKANRNKSAVLMLHGFPGWINKNYDIAERLALQGHSVFLPHYRGLGHSKGRFSFEKSITDIEALIETINAEFRLKKLSLIGHSWGGLVASIISPANLHKTCLLAPLINLPNKKALIKLTSDLIVEHPNDCGNHTPASLAALFRDLTGKILKKDLSIRAKNNQLVIFHGSQDSVINPALSKKLKLVVPKLRLNVLYDDHSFSKDRRHFLSLIESEFLSV